jgi:hypothetical protein
MLASVERPYFSSRAAAQSPKPPSTIAAAPVMKEASSLARNTASLPTSSGLPIRHSACSLPAAARAAAGPDWDGVVGFLALHIFEHVNVGQAFRRILEELVTGDGSVSQMEKFLAARYRDIEQAAPSSGSGRAAQPWPQLNRCSP